jgi:hypothetical protein
MRPRRFSEKMQWRKLFDLDPIHKVFSDKIATREYVAQRLGPDAVVPILWLGRDPIELPLETLRPPYIIKCSHGSGFNIVIRAGKVVDCVAIRAQLARWLAIDFGLKKIEPGYRGVPRWLLVEPLLTNRGDFPAEYKFFMFNGVGRFVLFRANYGDELLEHTNAYYDMQWRLLPIRTLDVPRANAVPCPPEFDTMRRMAERLTQQRDFIRVDCLVSDGRVHVGELTSYHESGLANFELDEHDIMLGEWWELRRPLSSGLDYHHT